MKTQPGDILLSGLPVPAGSFHSVQSTEDNSHTVQSETYSSYRLILVSLSHLFLCYRATGICFSGLIKAIGGR